MKRAIFSLSIGFIVLSWSFSYAQEGSIEKILILREAQEDQKSTVAIEAYLADNTLEVTIIARMPGTKPKIHNAIVVGPKLGRLSCESKEVLLATVEEDKPFPTKRKDMAFISFSKGEETKKARGTLTRERVVFSIPPEKVIRGKRYDLWVQIEGLQKGGKYKTFKFDLGNIGDLLSN
jgi:hypothetical protein